MNCNRCNLHVCTRSNCDDIPLRCVRMCPNYPNCLIPCGVFKLLFFFRAVYITMKQAKFCRISCVRGESTKKGRYLPKGDSLTRERLPGVPIRSEATIFSVKATRSHHECPPPVQRLRHVQVQQHVLLLSSYIRPADP
jgi:hypothetical protein